MLARWGRRAGAVGCLLLFSACAQQGATVSSHEVHHLYIVILILAAPVFLLVEGLLLWSVVRFRRRDDAPAPQTIGSNRALVGFFAFGAVIVAILFPFGEQALSVVDHQDPNPVVSIRLEAFQWEWTAFYLNEGIFSTGKTLRQPLVFEIPVDTPVKITLVSRDVMHEFFVPAFLFMRNAIPGRPTTFTFTADKIGTFPGQCAEFCGLWHSKMTFLLKVVSPTDYAAFVKSKTLHGFGGNCSPKGPAVHVVAHNTAWNTTCIAIAPGHPLALTVTNEDQGIQHNFGIWPSVTAAINKKGELFETGRFAGVATRSFQVASVASLPPGRYYFQCDVHGVAMAGAFIVKGPGHG